MHIYIYLYMYVHADVYMNYIWIYKGKKIQICIYSKPLVLGSTLANSSISDIVVQKKGTKQKKMLYRKMLIYLYTYHVYVYVYTCMYT